MKAREVLVFIAGVLSLLGLLWLVTPADGVNLGPLNLRFASYQRTLRDAHEQKVDVDSVLMAVESRFKMEADTLSYYRRFFYENPDRIFLPGDDYRFFDPVFRQMEGATDHLVRVVHYGDSQIELDRISQDLREALQERFGGSGTGLFPALGNVPSASISKAASGSFTQYTMYGDSTTQRAGHNRYGISVLYGKGENLVVKAASGTDKPEPEVRKGDNGTTLLTWRFSQPVEKAILTFQGNAELYGIGADGNAGVAVDNVPLRGCSGTIFTRISKPLMTDSFALTDTRLIILQFGGNMMPMIRSAKQIEPYQEQIAKQIAYFHEVAPQAKILFIGPSDMGKSVNGRVVTWPHLPELVDSLKATALRNDAAYWDLYRMMGGENSMAQWVRHSPPYAGPDYIHFTPAGAQKVGDALSRSFLTYYDFYTLRKTLPAQRVQNAMRP